MSEAEILIAILKEKNIIPEKVLGTLEKQVAQRKAAGKDVPARELAALLVKQNLLPEAQAKTLLAEAKTRLQADAAPQPPAEEEMLLAPLEEDELHKTVRKEQPRKTEPAAKAPSPEKAPGGKPPAPAADLKSDLESELGAELESLPPAGGGLDALDDAAMNANDPLAGPSPKSKKKGVFGAASVLQEQGGKKRKLEKKEAKENPWDSKLMVLGGGGLLLLVIMGVALFFALTWQSADELYELAEEDYKKASYTQAIEKYDKFIKKHPKHTSISRAKVHRGLSKMRQVVDPARNASQFSLALAETQAILTEIGPESAFGEASADLSAMLPKIAGGLSLAAMETLSPTLTAEAEEAVKLVDRHAAKEGTSARMNEVRSQIEMARRNASRDEELKKSITLVREKLAANDTVAAYALRAELVRNFTDLADDPRLLRVSLEIAEKEREQVRFVAENVAPGSPEPATASGKAAFSAENLALVQPAALAAGSRAGTAEVLRLVTAPDAIYAMNAMNGHVFWRYPLSGVLSTRTPQHLPVWVRENERAGRSGNDQGILFVDAKNQSLNFISGQTLRWVQPVAEKLGANVMVAGGEALLASESGKLHAFQVPGGEKTGHYTFTQPLETSPAWDADRKVIYQIASHSNMFALADAQRDGKPCVRVYHVGHRTGEVLLPPMVVGDFVLVLMNREGNTIVRAYPRADESRAVSLLGEKSEEPGTDAALLAAIAPVQEFTLTGMVDCPPQVLGERVLIVSDTGEMQVWSISAANEREPFQMIARGSGQDTAQAKSTRRGFPPAFFPLLNANEVYIAGSQLERFDIQSTNNRLQPRWVVNQDSVTLQPPEWIASAKTVLHVRQADNRAGMDVRALDIAQGEPQWDIQLAVPLVTEPVALKDGRVLVCTYSGAIFDVTAEVNAAGAGAKTAPGQDVIIQKIVAQVPAEYVPQQVAQCFADENGNFLLVPAGQSRQLLIYSAKSKKFQAKAVSDIISGTLLPYRTTMLVPCRKGQIFLVDGEEGTQKATPFQPKLRGEDFVWRIAQVGDKAQWIAADNHARLYRFSLQKVQDQRLPALLEDASVKLEASVAGEIAMAGDKAYFTNENLQLCMFQPLEQELKVTPIAELDAEMEAGPWCFGETLVAVNEVGEILAWNLAGKELWRTSLPAAQSGGYTLLAGKPVLQDGSLLAATVDGTFFALNPATGEVLKSSRFDGGFHTGAVIFGQKILVGTANGGLAVITENAE